MTILRHPLRAVALACLVAMAGTAAAQSSDVLQAAAQKAVQTSPDVAARFNAYRASLDATAAARAGYFPRLDVNASSGRGSTRIDSRTPQTDSLNRSGVTAALTQTLWDGLATQRDVSRAGHESAARWFELLDTTEQTALEAVRAVIDVQRYRRLVTLAEDNYVQHKAASLQIQSRFRAGVGRGVDLEQVNARLALAEANLSTEVSNLHDVMARYERVIGEAPPARLPSSPAGVGAKLPDSAAQTLDEVLRRNAAISASVESLRAARATADGRQSAFQPKIEARVRSGTGHNFDGVRDQTRDSAADIVLNWNLFNGGADQARLRQQVALMNQAADVRDRVCRDTRQSASIAFNDSRKLVEQLEYLDRNTLAIEKARDAYRQQFDIGQRSLLDLLNAENELYTARRAYANALHDLPLAQARTLAAMNQLTAQLGITRPAGAEAFDHWGAGEDGPGRCPVLTIEPAATDRAALDARAQALVANAPKPPVPPASAPAPATAPAAPPPVRKP